MTLPRRANARSSSRDREQPAVRTDVEERVKGLAAGNAGLAKGLVDIVRADLTSTPISS